MVKGDSIKRNSHLKDSIRKQEILLLKQGKGGTGLGQKRIIENCTRYFGFLGKFLLLKTLEVE